MSNQGTNCSAGPNTLTTFRAEYLGFSRLHYEGSDKILRQQILLDPPRPFPVWDPEHSLRIHLSSDIISIGTQNRALFEAMQGTNDFVNRLRLHAELAADASGSDGVDNDELVAKCKAQSVAVSKRFKDLCNTADGMLSRATSLAMEITYEQSTIQLKMVLVTGLLKTASELHKAKGEVLKMRQDELATAKMHLMFSRIILKREGLQGARAKGRREGAREQGRERAKGREGKEPSGLHATTEGKGDAVVYAQDGGKGAKHSHSHLPSRSHRACPSLPALAPTPLPAHLTAIIPRRLPSSALAVHKKTTQNVVKGK
ncbi:hypothetical protein B0H14DRAFT_2562410 [Mycena olivaceomarginata]|nr:hypothetical protein B0H14DRAFT_2562410 [Mycena olivaceomarginata]